MRWSYSFAFLAGASVQRMVYQLAAPAYEWGLVDWVLEVFFLVGFLAISYALAAREIKEMKLEILGMEEEL